MNQARGGRWCPSVSVVMPALDEAQGILAAVDDAAVALSELIAGGTIRGFELLVVDDGSVDRTAELVGEVAAEEPSVRLVRHGRNRGVGAALKSGITAATCDLVLYTDADMPVDLREMESALALLEPPGVGAVVGRRDDYRGEPVFRRWLSMAYDRLVRVLFDMEVVDVNFPFKLLETRLAMDLDLQSEGALIDVELVERVRATGLDVVSVEMHYRPRQVGASKTMNPRLLMTLAREMVCYRWSIRGRSGR